MFQSIIVPLILASLLFSCGVLPEEDDSSKSSGSADSTAGSGKVSSSLVIEAEDGGDDIPAANAEVQVQNHPEYSTTANDNGEVSMDMLPGTYTIMIDADLEDTALSDTRRSAMVKELVVKPGEETEFPEDTKLRKPGYITGSIALLNNPKNVDIEGAEVYVPGTSYLAKADSDGNFTLGPLPAGTFDAITFNQEGLTKSSLVEVTVVSGETTDVGTVNMSLSTGPSGEIVSIDNASSTNISGESIPVLTATGVTVNLRYDSRAVLMKLAHESAFTNVEWVPLAESFTFSSSNNSSATTHYSSDGQKDVYLKFADQNGLESSVYHQEFYVDTSAPSAPTVSIQDGWTQISQTATATKITLSSTSDSGTGLKEMMVCTASNFSGCSWQSYSAESFQSSLISGAGTVNIYVKVRDYLNQESSSGTSSIVAGSYTIIPSTTFSSDITLYTTATPYRFTDTITFDGDLTIQEGVSLDYNQASSDSQIVVNGRLHIDGSSGSAVTLTNSSGNFTGFDLTGSTSDNLIDYLTAIDTTSNASYLFNIDRGTIRNSTLEDSVRVIRKAGYGALSITQNDLTCKWRCIEVQSGTSATDVYDNNIASETGSFYIVDQQGGTGTRVRYNTITGDMVGAGAAYYIYAATGDMTVEYNNMAIGTGALPNFVRNDGTGTITLDHNNLSFTVDAASRYHIIAGASATVTATDNYYSGCDATCGNANPQTSGGTITTSAAGTAWPTSGSTCVGHLCN